MQIQVILPMPCTTFSKLSTAEPASQYCSTDQQTMAPQLENDGKQLLYTSITFIIVTALGVGLRIVAKQQTKSHFARDDIYMVAALVAFGVYSAIIIASK